jgi:hypothetical protein
MVDIRKRLAHLDAIEVPDMWPEIERRASAQATATPTVIGRTQSMFSPVKTITAGAIVFALGGVLLIAQPFEQQGRVPGAATDDSRVATYVHGEWMGDACCGDEVETHDGDGNRLTLRNMTDGGPVLSNDPRLEGTFSMVWNLDEFAQLDSVERAELSWGEFRIENEGGVWFGTASNVRDLEQPDWTSHTVYQLTGEDGYEGLSALLFSTNDDTWAGIVFPGDLPPNR